MLKELHLGLQLDDDTRDDTDIRLLLRHVALTSRDVEQGELCKEASDILESLLAYFHRRLPERVVRQVQHRERGEVAEGLGQRGQPIVGQAQLRDRGV